LLFIFLDKACLGIAEVESFHSTLALTPKNPSSRAVHGVPPLSLQQEAAELQNLAIDSTLFAKMPTVHGIPCLIFYFSTDHHLSLKDIDVEAGEDEDPKLEIIPLLLNQPMIKGVGLHHWVAWKVVPTHLKVHTHGKIEVKSKKAKLQHFWRDLLVVV
jgi:hypothetical protein